MKKPSNEGRAYSIRVTAKRTARNQRLRTKGYGQKKRTPAVEGAVLIAAPQRFGMETEETRGDLVRFLRKLREWAVTKDLKVRIDFSATRRMELAGTLLFAAELDRIKAYKKVHRVSCTYPRDVIVAQVLQHVGIFEILGQKRTLGITHETVKYWKIDTGASVEGERAAHAIDGYKNLFTDPERQALYRALTEAMTNCRQHAYPVDEDKNAAHYWWTSSEGGKVRRWWMFSQLRDNRLSVGLCDLGIGIPRSLRLNRAGLLGSILEFIRAVQLLPNDANLIRGAMAIGMSRTKEQHRGKGLMDMRSVLDGLKGTLQIHSGRGFYAYRAETNHEQCRNFAKSMSIDGTLVLWEIPVVPIAQQASAA